MGVNADIYLRNACKELDSFSLPQIGTFRKVYLSSHIDEENQKIYPPRVEIEFSPRPDSRLSLSRYLSSQFQMSSAEAERIETGICREIEEEVRGKGDFFIPEMGRMYWDTHNNYAYAPDAKSRERITAEFFGLKPIELNQFPKEKSKLVTTESEEKPMTPTTPPTKTASGNKRSSYSAMALLLLVLIIASGGIFLWQNQALERSSTQNDNYLSVVEGENSSEDFLAENFRTKDPESKEKKVMEPEVEASEASRAIKQADSKPIASAESRENSSATPPATTTNPRARTSPPLAEENSRGLESQGMPRGAGSTEEEDNVRSVDKSTARLSPSASSYHLISGSFAQESRAGIFRQQLLKEGYKAVQILHSPEIGKYRVSVFSSNSIRDVKIFQSNLKEQGLRTGWILEDKKK